MTWNNLEKRWDEFAGSARAHWSELTDDDWLRVKGTKKHLIERVGQRYRVSSAEAEKLVDEWAQAVPDVPRERVHSR